MLHLIMQLHKQYLKNVHNLKNVEQINETFVDEATHINITMSMDNLIKYSDNFSDTSGTSWQ